MWIFDPKIRFWKIVLNVWESWYIGRKNVLGAQKTISYAYMTLDNDLNKFSENRIFGRFLKILKFWNFTFGPKKPLKTVKNHQKPSFHNLYRLSSKISKMAQLTRRNFQNPIYLMSMSRFCQNPSKPSNTVLDAKRHKKSKNFKIFKISKISAFSQYIHCWGYSQHKKRYSTLKSGEPNFSHLWTISSYFHANETLLNHYMNFFDKKYDHNGMKKRSKL